MASYFECESSSRMKGSLKECKFKMEAIASNFANDAR